MTGIIVALVVLLGIIAFAQIMKVLKTSSELNEGNENEITEKDNNIQGWIMLLAGVAMVVGFFAMIAYWGDVVLPQSASEEGKDYDNLWAISMGLIVLVFLITEPLLFGFAFLYRGVNGRKAVFHAHDNKLEIIWTIVPALVLATLITYGLTTWVNIMNPEHEEEPLSIELYARQFDWHARYSGADNKLGYANVRFVEGTNVVGVDMEDDRSQDDFVVKEIHLPVGKPVTFQMRSQDVIHSAYMPHFRAQMNCVPGAITNFTFTPTITTKEMRNDPDVVAHVTEIDGIRKEMGEEGYMFDYILLCNKICGSAHYNMQLKIVVETEEEYNQWLSQQTALSASL